MKVKEIKLTQGNINQGHFYIQRDTEIIPKDAWGGNNRSAAAVPLLIKFDGTGEEISTDIDFGKKVLRDARGHSRRFLEHYKCKAGDSIYLNQIGDRKYFISLKNIYSIKDETGIESYRSTERAESIISRIV